MKNQFTPDFQFQGYFTHGRSGLNLSLMRPYKSSLCRWLSRDQIGQSSLNLQSNGIAELQEGANLFFFVQNNPISYIDRLGMDCDCYDQPRPPSGPNSPCGQYGSSQFQFTSEMCVCACMGDSAWANKMRGCLACVRNKLPKLSNTVRHYWCFKGTGGDGGDILKLAGCAASCSTMQAAY